MKYKQPLKGVKYLENAKVWSKEEKLDITQTQHDIRMNNAPLKGLWNLDINSWNI